MVEGKCEGLRDCATVQGVGVIDCTSKDKVETVSHRKE